MKRRDFLAAGCAAGLGVLGRLASAAESSGPGKKELYELRLYRLKSEAQRRRLDAFLREAAVPAWNRAGIKPVGVFQFMDDKRRDLYVLLPHPSAESVVTATHRMMADREFLQAGDAFLKAPKSDPGYERVESTLLLAFDGVPKLERPTKAKTRIFQLRIYESHSVERGQKKIEMFNTGGEVAIFRRCGMGPVFFGEALVGGKIPSLTYMLGFDDMDARKAAWGKFMRDPGWRKISRDPAYKDTVSNITNMFLRPASSSQV